MRKYAFGAGDAVSLLNPFTLIRGEKTWKPQFLRNTIDSQAGEVVWKLGSLAAIYGGIGALVRGYKALREYNRPQGGLKVEQKLDPTDQPMISSKDINELQKKSASLKKAGEDESKTLSFLTTVGNTAIPIAAAGLSGVLGYRMMDDIFDRGRKQELKEKQAIRDSIARRVVAARALQARGQLDQAALDRLVADAAPLFRDNAINIINSKTASLHKTAGENIDREQDRLWNSAARIFWGCSGLLLLTAAAASGYATYKSTVATDDDTLEAKAMRKGLEEYAANKTKHTPLTNAALAPDVMQKLNPQKPQSQTAQSFMMDAPSNQVSVI